MGNLCINFGGGGGITSDDVTTTRDTVLAGFKTLMTDSNDEPVEGAIPVYSGNVKAEQVYLDDNKVTFGTPYGYSRFNNSSNDMRSVSYTHLDVYKRQQPHVHSVNHQILSMPGVAAVVTGMVHTVKAGLEAVEMAEIGLTTLHLAEHLEQVVVVVDYAKDGGMMLAPVVLELQ